MTEVTRRGMMSGGLSSLGAAGVAAVPVAGSAPVDAGTGLLWLCDRAALATTTVPADILEVVVTRYDRSSPPCPARYARVTSAPTNPCCVRSRDGAMWRLAEPVVDVAMLGTGDDVIARALAALDGRPGTVRLRGERYRVTQPIRLRAGQSLIGAGWASLADAGVAPGSTILQLAGSDIGIDIVGDTADHPVERVRVGHMAIVGNGKGTGIRLRDARHFALDDLYLARLDTGLLGAATAWMGACSRIQCFACRIGFDLNSGTEDTSFRNCIVRYADIACRINYHSQTNYFSGCDFGYARVSVLMIGAVGMRVNATFESCIFEFKPPPGDDPAIFEVTGPASADMADYPSLSCRGCRFHALGDWVDAPIFLVRRANRISMTDCRGGGRMGTVVRASEGAVLGGMILSGNDAVARTMLTGDAGMRRRIIDTTGGIG